MPKKSISKKSKKFRAKYSTKKQKKPQKSTRKYSKKIYSKIKIGGYLNRPSEVSLESMIPQNLQSFVNICNGIITDPNLNINANSKPYTLYSLMARVTDAWNYAVERYANNMDNIEYAKNILKQAVEEKMADIRPDDITNELSRIILWDIIFYIQGIMNSPIIRRIEILPFESYTDEEDEPDISAIDGDEDITAINVDDDAFYTTNNENEYRTQ